MELLAANSWVTICGAASLACIVAALCLSYPAVKALNRRDNKGLSLAALSLLLALAAIVIGNVGIVHMADPIEWPPATKPIPSPMPVPPQPNPVIRV